MILSPEHATVEIVTAHAEGEVGDVVVAGVPPPPGDSLWAQRDFLAADQRLRRFLLNEPRGGVFRHVNLLVPPRHPEASHGFLIMEPEDTPPMSGSNSLCVATVLLATGRVPMTEPETVLTLEAPGGLVRVRATCRAGRVERVAVANLPSFVDRLDAPLEVEGLGTLAVDTAFGGDSFVIVDAARLGLALVPAEAADLARLGMRITAAATAQLGFGHPDWRHVSFCFFAGPLAPVEGGWTARGAVAIRPGKIDRSPTGTGCSARLAVLHARGLLPVGGRYLGRSIIDSTFDCRILGRTEAFGRPAILPEIAGRAWVTGFTRLLRDPGDPWPEGYRLADTWPAMPAGTPSAATRGDRP